MPILRFSGRFDFGRVSVLFLLCRVVKKLLNLEMICTVSLKIVVNSSKALKNKLKNTK